MEFIKGWTLAVCMACIAAGILQHFAARHERFSVIKLVLTLYILITAFAPLQALRYPLTRMDLPAVATVQPVDTQALILQQAQASLETTLVQECSAQGVALDFVAVTLTPTDSGTVVEQVVYTAQDSAAAQKAIQALVGQAVPVMAKEE